MLSFDQQLQSSSLRLLSAIDRIRRIQSTPALASESTPLAESTRQEALAFNLERAAWSLVELAQAWVYELRLGLPRKETENFDLLQRHGWLELDTARKLKQLSEFRSLSSREPERTDWRYLGSDLEAELALFTEWAETARQWTEKPR